MTTKTALFALLAAWGVGTGACVPALGEESPAEETAAKADELAPAKRSFTNRVWTQTGAELPGVMRIFLSDGTLVQDSCWETHRLSERQMTSATSLSWDEDGMEVTADIVSVSAGSLVLSVNLGSETVEERYTAADVPFLCPDMPKD